MVGSIGSARPRRPAPPPPSALEPGASQADVDKALIAAPPNQKNLATVIKWKPDFTYETLQEGHEPSGLLRPVRFPAEQPFSVQCTSIGNLERVAQNLKAEAAGDAKKTEAMLDAAEKDGTRVKPEYGSMWYNVGTRPGAARTHHTIIAVPGATTQSTGLPDNPNQGGAWVMNAGTTTAHVMLPS